LSRQDAKVRFCGREDLPAIVRDLGFHRGGTRVAPDHASGGEDRSEAGGLDKGGVETRGYGSQIRWKNRHHRDAARGIENGG